MKKHKILLTIAFTALAVILNSQAYFNTIPPLWIFLIAPFLFPFFFIYIFIFADHNFPQIVNYFILLSYILLNLLYFYLLSDTIFSLIKQKFSKIKIILFLLLTAFSLIAYIFLLHSIRTGKATLGF